jgi:hypothetical protein
MSGFVPIQPGKSFHAGVLGGGTESTAGDAPKATVEGDSVPAEDAGSPDAEEAGVELPSDGLHSRPCWRKPAQKGWRMLKRR